MRCATFFIKFSLENNLIKIQHLLISNGFLFYDWMQDCFTHSHLSVEASHEKLSALEREKALLAEVKEWQDQWKTERKMYAKLKGKIFYRYEVSKCNHIKIDILPISVYDMCYYVSHDSFVHYLRAGHFLFPFLYARHLTDILWYGVFRLSARTYVCTSVCSVIHNSCGQDIARTMWSRMLKRSVYTSYGKRKKPI